MTANGRLSEPRRGQEQQPGTCGRSTQRPTNGALPQMHPPNLGNIQPAQQDHGNTVPGHECGVQFTKQGTVCLIQKGDRQQSGTAIPTKPREKRASEDKESIHDEQRDAIIDKVHTTKAKMENPCHRHEVSIKDWCTATRTGEQVPVRKISVSKRQMDMRG